MRQNQLNNCNGRVSLSRLGCGHCQNAKPKFLKASEAFADEPNKAFTTVDCTQDGGKLIKNNLEEYKLGHDRTKRLLQGNHVIPLILIPTPC